MIHRIGKIVRLDDDGRGALVDTRYRQKGYHFIASGYRAGQCVIYTTTDLNPLTGFSECEIIAPKLWPGENNKELT